MVGVPICVPFLNTLYPVRFEPPASVDAVQVSFSVVWVTSDAVGCPGVVGFVVSGVVSGARVVLETEADFALLFPALSIASIW